MPEPSPQPLTRDEILDALQSCFPNGQWTEEVFPGCTRFSLDRWKLHLFCAHGEALGGGLLGLGKGTRTIHTTSFSDLPSLIQALDSLRLNLIGLSASLLHLCGEDPQKSTGLVQAMFSPEISAALDEISQPEEPEEDESLLDMFGSQSE